MDIGLQNKCDLFIQNKEIVQKAFKWENDRMNLLAGSMFAGAGRVADVDKLKECEQQLKHAAGIFSEFRGNLKMVLLVKMALSDNPTEFFEGVEQVYKMINKKHLFGSDMRLLAAVSIFEHSGVENAEQVIARTNEIYNLMKKEHPFLTSEENIPFAALLALSGADTDKLLDEAERCYSAMKDKFFSSNAVQSLSHIMALDEQPTEVKTDKIAAIYNGLKQNKKKFGTGSELAALGVLAMSDQEVGFLVREISEVDDFLKNQKGFGIVGVGAAERLLYAALLVADYYMPQSHIQGVVIESSLAAVIAEEMLLLATLSVTTASVAASSN